MIPLKNLDAFQDLYFSESYCLNCQALFGCYKHAWVKMVPVDLLAVTT